MSTASSPIKVFTPRKKLETDRLGDLRAKIVKESSNLYKLPTNNNHKVSSELSYKMSNSLPPISSPSKKQEELNMEQNKQQSIGGRGGSVSVRRRIGRGSTLQKDQFPSIEWEHPDLAKIEKRLVNKELESKKVVLNILLLLSSGLVYNFIELVWNKLDASIPINSPFESLENFQFKNLLLFLQLLFIWNICSGLYKVIKPQDQFTDLSLTPHQRELLGLPQVPIPVNQSRVSKRTNLELRPIEAKILSDGLKLNAKSKSSSTSTTSTTTTSNSEDPKIKALKQSHTPIASPMSSPSKQFSPRKFNTSTTNSLNLNKAPESKQIASIKSQELSTPTYIPSPKYYYRMDSPSRTRRRVV